MLNFRGEYQCFGRCAAGWGGLGIEFWGFKLRGYHDHHNGDLDVREGWRKGNTLAGKACEGEDGHISLVFWLSIRLFSILVENSSVAKYTIFNSSVNISLKKLNKKNESCCSPKALGMHEISRKTDLICEEFF